MPTTLDDLIAGLPGAMQNEILTPEQKAARIQQAINGVAPGALRQYGQTTQQQNEAAFGKGMGLSTWNAYQQALNTLMQNEGIANIQANAQTAIDQAQRAAIGNAASYATAEQNRAAQRGMNTENNAARSQLQRQQMNQQGKLLNQQQLYGGLMGLAGGGANLLTRTFEPEIRGGLRAIPGGIKGLYNKAFGGPQTEEAPNIGAQDLSGLMEPGAGVMEPSGYDFNTSMPGGFDFTSPQSFDFGTGYGVMAPDMSLDSLLNQQNWWDF